MYPTLFSLGPIEVSSFGLMLIVGFAVAGWVAADGFEKLGLPRAEAFRLLPWAVFGFVLCVVTGLLFVTGLWSNVAVRPLEAVKPDLYLQLKLLFIFLAGVNLLVFFRSGMSRAVDSLGPGDDAPLLAKVIAASSLFLWVGVVYWGRLIPWGL